MAKHQVLIKRVEVKTHDNADRLEIAQVGGYQCVIGKGNFETGDVVAYIPEDSLVPEWILKRLGLEGKLAGPDKNRVKTVRLRGVTSQGICFPVDWDQDGLPYLQLEPEDFVNRYYLYDHPPADRQTIKSRIIDVDVKHVLDIQKYEPPVPIHMSGEVFNARGNTLYYDIENVKKFPDVLQKTEQVVMTEKLHGTWCCIGVVPESEASEDAGRLIITSKGLSKKGLAFKLNETNEKNLYVRAARASGLLERLPAEKEGYFYLLGEVFGKGVQDLQYGAEDIRFRAFDAFEGKPDYYAPDGGQFLSDARLDRTLSDLGVERVPVLYRGPYDEDTLKAHTEGDTSLRAGHVREGVVVRPTCERKGPEQLPMNGRVQLKSINEAYLLRNEGTEYT
jgi:RNA ligase (TIGR02306 family)